MKIIKTFSIIFSAMLLLFPAVSISAEKTAKSTENTIIVDLSDVELKPVNLVADYDADHADLIEQQKEMDEEYQLLKSEYESGKVTTERKRELEILLQGKINYFEASATSLLSSRYTKDRTKLQEKITRPFTKTEDQVNIFSSDTATKDGFSIVSPDTETEDGFSIMSSDWLLYPEDETRDTGNYGDVDVYNSNDTGYYGHSPGDNWGQADSLQTGYSTVLNGWEFLAVVDYPDESFVVDELNIRHIDGSGSSECGLNSYGAVKVSGVFYNQTTNQLLSRVVVDADTCFGDSLSSTGSASISIDNMRVNFVDKTLNYNEHYLVATETFAEDTNVKASTFSTYEFIEAIFH